MESGSGSRFAAGCHRQSRVFAWERGIQTNNILNYWPYSHLAVGGPDMSVIKNAPLINCMKNS